MRKQSIRLIGAVLASLALAACGAAETEQTASSGDVVSAILIGESEESGTEEKNVSAETVSDAESAEAEEAAASEAEEPEEDTGTQFGWGDTGHSAEIPAEDVDDGTRVCVRLILPGMTGLDEVEETVIRDALEEAGYEVTVSLHGGDVQKQEDAFADAIASGAALIICDNLPGEEILACVQEARDADVPTILLNQGMSTTGVALSQVITDRYTRISKLALAFAEKEGEKGQYLILTDETDTQAADYVTGFTDFLSSYPKMTEVDTLETGTLTEEEISERITEAVRLHPEIGAFVCWNGTAARAALDAIAENAMNGKIVICLNGDNVSEEIGSGIYAAIVKPAQTLAETAAAEALAYLENGSTGQNECMYFAGELQVAGAAETETDTETETAEEPAA